MNKYYVENHVTDVLSEGAAQRGQRYVNRLWEYKLNDVDSGKVKSKGKCRVTDWRYSTAIDGDEIVIQDLDTGAMLHTNGFEAEFGKEIKDPELVNRYQALQVYVNASHEAMYYERIPEGGGYPEKASKRFWTVGMVLTDARVREKTPSPLNRPMLASCDAYGEMTDAENHVLYTEMDAALNTKAILHAVMRAVTYAKKHGYASMRVVANHAIDETCEAYATYKAWFDAHGNGIRLQFEHHPDFCDSAKHDKDYEAAAFTKQSNAGIRLTQEFYDNL